MLDKLSNALDSLLSTKCKRNIKLYVHLYIVGNLLDWQYPQQSRINKQSWQNILLGLRTYTCIFMYFNAIDCIANDINGCIALIIYSILSVLIQSNRTTIPYYFKAPGPSV